MSQESTLVILNKSFKKEGSGENIEGLTIVVDGVIKQVFDKIKSDRQYEGYNEVLEDIIFEGLNSIRKGGFTI